MELVGCRNELLDKHELNGDSFGLGKGFNVLKFYTCVRTKLNSIERDRHLYVKWNKLLLRLLVRY